MERAEQAAAQAAEEASRKVAAERLRQQQQEERLLLRKRQREEAAEAERRAEEEALKSNVIATPVHTMRSSRFHTHDDTSTPPEVSHRSLFATDKALEMGINRVGSRVEQVESTMRRLLSIAVEAGEGSDALGTLNSELTGGPDRKRLDELEERITRLELITRDFAGTCEKLQFVAEQKLAHEREKAREEQFQRDRDYEHLKRQHDIANEQRRAELEIERVRLTGSQAGLEAWQIAAGAGCLVVAAGLACLCCVRCSSRKGESPKPRAPGPAAQPPSRADHPVSAVPHQLSPAAVAPKAPAEYRPPPPSFDAEVVRQPSGESSELRNRFLNRWDQSRE
jgi:hypothetical protein